MPRTLFCRVRFLPTDNLTQSAVTATSAAPPCPENCGARCSWTAAENHRPAARAGTPEIARGLHIVRTQLRLKAGNRTPADLEAIRRDPPAPRREASKIARPRAGSAIHDVETEPGSRPVGGKSMTYLVVEILNPDVFLAACSVSAQSEYVASAANVVAHV